MRVTSSGLASKQKRGFEAWIQSRGTSYNVCLSLCWHLVSLFHSLSSAAVIVFLLLWWCLIISFRCDKDLILSFLLFSSLHWFLKVSYFLSPKSFYSPWGLSTSFLNSLFYLFQCMKQLVILTLAKINFSTNGREIVEVEQPAGFFHLFGDLGISWIQEHCWFL